MAMALSMVAMMARRSNRAGLVGITTRSASGALMTQKGPDAIRAGSPKSPRH